MSRLVENRERLSGKVFFDDEYCASLSLSRIYLIYLFFHFNLYNYTIDNRPSQT